MRESLIEGKSCQWAKAQGWLSYKFVSPSQSGVPDRLFIRNAEVVFVEFKATGEQLRPLQVKVIDKMRTNGATVHVIDSVEGFINVMS
jgi:hypothetical protein